MHTGFRYIEHTKIVDGKYRFHIVLLHVRTRKFDQRCPDIKDFKPLPADVTQSCNAQDF